MRVGENSERLAEVKAVYGDGAAEIFGAFDRLGISITQTSKDLQKAAKQANKIGVNTAKIMETLKDNIGAIDKYTFRKPTMVR